MKKLILLATIRLFVIGVMITVNACCTENSAPDTQYLASFHKTYFENETNVIHPENLSLYVDYSTCISLGQHSSFFQSMIPSFVEATKHYYSIKGSKIQEEVNINVFDALKNIVGVNYADLKNAADQIAKGDSEAVLLTDGEYYQKNIAGGNINHPYMAEAFKTWLKKGHDIYILTEPYIESYKGQQYNKKRFYFLFTDNRLQGNIYDRIRQTVKLDNFPYVELFHLSADHPTIMAEGKSSKVNTTLAASIQQLGNFEIQDWPIDWESIQNVIMSAVEPDSGIPLPNGECVIGGLHVDKNSYGGFRISDIDIKVSDINVDYFNYYNDMIATGKSEIQPTVVDCPNFIILDKEEFKRHGVVNLFFDTQLWNPQFLTGCPFNYFKIDICVAACENVFDNYASLFNFDAIGIPGEQNVSITESVKQCLFNPDIQKMMNSAVLYTIYVKSNQF